MDALLRPTDIPYNRFFVNYENGRCTKKLIGKNEIIETPKAIAVYLNLDQPESYTENSLRRCASTAATNVKFL